MARVCEATTVAAPCSTEQQEWAAVFFIAAAVIVGHCDGAEHREQQSEKKQAEQLRRLRSKFDQERDRRLKNQYVTKNFAEFEVPNRGDFGLPDNYAKHAKSPVKAVKKDPPVPVTLESFHEKRAQLRKKYSTIFDVNMGPTWDPRAKTPRMDGFDTISFSKLTSIG